MATIPQGAQDVGTPDAARAAAEAIGRASELSVDVEADAMHAFRARLCFVQVATDQNVFLFDTLAPTVRAEVLAGTFADPQRTKFFHAAGGDLQYLAEAGVRVKGLFDTHRAATLLGWAKVGLADLVQERLGVTLDKAHQQSDFSLRPLPPGMREYIADDVRYLVEIGRQVREECVKADILEEVLLDCQRMSDDAAERPDLSQLRPKLPKGGLSSAQVALGEALVAQLHEKRLQWAEGANVPMGRMLSNAAIVAIATKPPQNKKELQRAQGVRGAFVREHGDEVLELVRTTIERARRGELTPELAEKGPRDPKKKKREDALKAWRAEKAKERKVTASAVLSNPLVETLSKGAPSNLDELRAVPYLGEKRVRLYGPELLEVLRAV
ncbi:MAG: ribonuclease D [Myxococcota bacterium]